ncbi:SLBB domain-containing protein [Roseateles sp.]|uniref:SLBB domain-containing protein n=1 Tax=Roseateles sp. TaxID=1971397 RepID=UPI003BAC2AAD
MTRSALLALSAAVLANLAGVATAATEPQETATNTGPVKLVSPSRLANEAGNDQPTQPRGREDHDQLSPVQRRLLMTDFERQVHRIAGEDSDVRRFGADLLSQRNSPQGEASSQIPQDYVISIGDELVVNLWGSVEADLRLIVDRSGRITIPRVGPVLVAGLRYSELNTAIDQRVAQVFRNYRLSASLGRLRSIRVYVTGFTQRPGAYTVNSLSTIVNALIQAGGPSAAGSFRNIELRRGSKLISQFDMYDLLLRGDKSADRVLQADDVVHIGPIGLQAALIGSVNRQAIFELKPGEVVNDLLLMGGGLNAVADRTRLAVESVDTRNDIRIVELALPAQGRTALKVGDVVRAFNAMDNLLPQHRQNKRIKIEGEVQRPGEYILPANSTLTDAISAAGGLTAGAFVYGSEFSRESVRVTQQVQYERALRDMETEFARVQVTQKAATADEASAQNARAQSSNRLIERLRNVRPTGRIVLQLPPTATTLPELALEDGDRLTIPARPTTVGVFGSVFNGGSFVLNQGASIDDMLKLAGGPTRGADSSGTFVIRANGSVVSAKQQSSGWISMGTGFSTLAALPGDTIFVPEDLTKTTFSQEAKDWTQILYQFGIGAAALKTIRN